MPRNRRISLILAVSLVGLPLLFAPALPVRRGCANERCPRGSRGRLVTLGQSSL